jgi:RimJ/RimL family protein N-acetyltransferase
MTRDSELAMTNDVRLREVTEEDLPILFEQQRDPDATKMAAFPSRDRDAFMAHWKTILGDATGARRTILFDGQVAGNIVSFEQSGLPLVGYWLGREFWGRGIATRALAQFLESIQTRPLYAHVAKHNIASIRVLEKCGFTISGENKLDSDTPEEVIEELIMKLPADGGFGPQ